jgi:hypothetical protein
VSAIFVAANMAFPVPTSGQLFRVAQRPSFPPKYILIRFLHHDFATSKVHQVKPQREVRCQGDADLRAEAGFVSLNGKSSDEDKNYQSTIFEVRRGSANAAQTEPMFKPLRPTVHTKRDSGLRRYFRTIQGNS